MTLEEVKNDLWSFTDWKIIMFLIAEIEKLEISLAMAEDAARKGDPVRNEAQATLDMAVARCAEIAESLSLRSDDMGATIANSIRKEFNI